MPSDRFTVYQNALRQAERRQAEIDGKLQAAKEEFKKAKEEAKTLGFASTEELKADIEKTNNRIQEIEAELRVQLKEFLP